DPRPRADRAASPTPARDLAVGRGVNGGVPFDAARARLRRDPNTKDRRRRHREWRERFSDRLLWPPGFPRAEAAALPADHGRRLRAGFRGWASFPRRAARYPAPPESVRLARRRDGLYREPSNGDGRADSGDPGHGRARRAGGGRRGRSSESNLAARAGADS